jgi:hypothetical protein
VKNLVGKKLKFNFCWATLADQFLKALRHVREESSLEIAKLGEDRYEHSVGWRYQGSMNYSNPKVKKVGTDERDVLKVDWYKLSLNFV